MRLYIRNRARYNPETPNKPAICLEVHDYAQTYIWQLKEDFRKQAPSAKCEELFYFNAQICHRLEDGRSVAHYRFHDGDILETTSNPFWASCMYILQHGAKEEQKKVSPRHPFYEVLRGSIIRKSTILGVLFNSDKDSAGKQPEHFVDIQEFIDFIRAHTKKGTGMSPSTIDRLYELHDDFMDNDEHKKDPIGSFVEHQAELLGFRRTDRTHGSLNDDSELQKKKRQRAVSSKSKKSTPVKRATPKKKNPAEDRACDHCGDSIAFIYCPDCAEGSVYCEDCSEVLHRAPGKRSHGIQDIAMAPKPKKGYVPQPYRAPFAVILALYRGVVDRPSDRLLSMTEDELKERAQTVTDTDLSQKSPGKWFAGFDCVNNLITKGLLKREATEKPTYALTRTGIQLGEKLDGFHNRFYQIQTEGDLPELPDLGPDGMSEGLVINGRRVCLVFDKKEKQFERFESLCRERGVPVVRRNLPSGDYLWLLLPHGAGPNYNLDQWDLEQVLPFIVERKSWDDLQGTIRSDRFEKQISKMLKTGLKNVFYVVEGNINDMRSRPDEEQKTFYRNQLKDVIRTGLVKVNYTSSWLKTVYWLHWLTLLAARSHNAAVSRGKPIQLCTYREYMTRANGKGTGHVKKAQELKHVHVLSGEQFIENIFRDHQNIQRIQASTRQLIAETIDNVQTEYGEHLLIVQGLEAYNKRRQSELNTVMNSYATKNGEPQSDVISEYFRNNIKGLVHYDIASYNQLLLQVALGLHVMRTETDEETESVRRRIATRGWTLNGNISMGRRRIREQFDGDTYENPPLPKLPRLNTPDEEAQLREAIRISKLGTDEVNASLDDGNMLQTVLERSRHEAKLDSEFFKARGLALSDSDEDEQLKRIVELSRKEYVESQKFAESDSDQYGSTTPKKKIEKSNTPLDEHDVIDLVTRFMPTQPKIPSDGGTNNDPISLDDSEDSGAEIEETNKELKVRPESPARDIRPDQPRNGIVVNENTDASEIGEVSDHQKKVQLGREEKVSSKRIQRKSLDRRASVENLVPRVSPGIEITSPDLTKQQNFILNQSKDNTMEKKTCSEALSQDEDSTRTDNFNQLSPATGARTPVKPRKRHGSPTHAVEPKRRLEIGLFESRSAADDETYARKLQEVFNMEAKSDADDKFIEKTSILSQDEVFARRLSTQDEDMARELTSQSKHDEDNARKISHEDHAYAKKNHSLSKDNEIFAGKVSGGKSLEASAANDEAVARALQEELLGETIQPPSTDQDAEFARQLNERLNSDGSTGYKKNDVMGPSHVMGRQTARVEPLAISASVPAAGSLSPAATLVPPRGKQSARTPSATYTPLSATQGDSFADQLASFRAQRRQQFWKDGESPATKKSVRSTSQETYPTAYKEIKSPTPNKSGTTGGLATTIGTEMKKKGESGSSGGLTCGACGGMGHSRSMKCCPRFNDSDEVERRNLAKAKRLETQMRKSEEKKHERENTIKQFEQTKERIRQAEEVLKEQNRQIEQQLRRLKRQEKAAASAQRKRNNQE